MDDSRKRRFSPLASLFERVIVLIVVVLVVQVTLGPITIAEAQAEGDAQIALDDFRALLQHPPPPPCGFLAVTVFLGGPGKFIEDWISIEHIRRVAIVDGGAVLYLSRGKLFTYNSLAEIGRRITEARRRVLNGCH